ncbi:MAG: response regulator [Candidatus Hodarchaeota archaeon]
MSLNKSEFQPANYNLLVVDDEPDTRNLAKKILEFEGFNVHLAGDGEEALQIARNENLDLILLDVRLPKANGFEVCKRIKDMDNKTKIPLIIFFTVLSLNADKEKAKDAGGDGFLIKPFSADNLISYLKHKLMGEN